MLFIYSDTMSVRKHEDEILELLQRAMTILFEALKLKQERLARRGSLILIDGGNPPEKKRKRRDVFFIKREDDGNDC
jgi:hypothetical protein